MTTHLQRFIDRVQGVEARGARDLTIPIGDARAIHADLTRLLLELQTLREQLLTQKTTDNEVIQVEMHGGSF